MGAPRQKHEAHYHSHYSPWEILIMHFISVHINHIPAAQRDCRKTPSLKNVHKNLPQQAQKSPKCCSEHKKLGTFQCFCPTFQNLFLKRDFFDSFNGLRSRSIPKAQWSGRHAVLSSISRLCSIPKENHAAAKAAFIQKLKLQSNLIRKGVFAASYQNRSKKQMAFID